MITTIGVSYILFNIILLACGADGKNFPNPLPAIRYHIGGAVLRHARDADLDRRAGC